MTKYIIFFIIQFSCFSAEGNLIKSLKKFRDEVYTLNRGVFYDYYFNKKIFEKLHATFEHLDEISLNKAESEILTEIQNVSFRRFSSLDHKIAIARIYLDVFNTNPKLKDLTIKNLNNHFKNQFNIDRYDETDDGASHLHSLLFHTTNKPIYIRKIFLLLDEYFDLPEIIYVKYIMRLISLTNSPVFEDVVSLNESIDEFQLEYLFKKSLSEISNLFQYSELFSYLKTGIQNKRDLQIKMAALTGRYGVFLFAFGFLVEEYFSMAENYYELILLLENALKNKTIHFKEKEIEIFINTFYLLDPNNFSVDILESEIMPVARYLNDYQKGFILTIAKKKMNVFSIHNYLCENYLQKK